MRENTYIKLNVIHTKYRGYISTRQLLDEGFSNRQINTLICENYLEKVCCGHYWMIQCGYDKPNDYKCIEVCLSNPRAVICLDSACYYQAAIKEEPRCLSVATCRTDRGSMKMNFEIRRHYFIERYFDVAQKKVNTEFGEYNLFEVERSVCDMVRLRAGDYVEIITNRNAQESFQKRVQKYAQLLGVRGLDGVADYIKDKRGLSYGKK